MNNLVTFDDVAGQEQAVTELREVSDFLRSRALRDPWRPDPAGAPPLRPPRLRQDADGSGPGGEAGAEFYSISGSDFVELYVGVGAARVRDLFKEARENAPAIVFIDELDAVGRRRVGGTAAGGPPRLGGAEPGPEPAARRDRRLQPRQGVIVIGATNRPDVLDPALLRPGRFDRAVGLELPDEHDRLEILGPRPVEGTRR